MKKEQNVLKIKMLGEFSIQNDAYIFPQKKKRNMQLGLLLAYLLANRSIDTLKSRLIEVLWPDDESDNPEGALRNLVYRARMELKHFFPEEEKNCLLLDGNAYLWNDEIECEIDIDQFERYCKIVSVEQDIDLKYQYCEKAMELYRGDFLPEYSGHDWVVFRAAYYRDLYSACLLKVCTSLSEHGRYEQVIDLCGRIVTMEQMDSQIHELKIRAYLELKKPQKALDYYNYVVDLFYSRVGVSLTDNMKKLYQEILSSMSNKPVNVEELEQDLMGSDAYPGTYYCNYDVFKNIYQISARLVKRSLRARFLALLTIRNPDGTLTSAQIQEESERLLQIISTNLRKSDIFSQYNTIQYSVILVAQNRENAMKAVNRICEKFEQKKGHRQTVLETEVRQIM